MYRLLPVFAFCISVSSTAMAQTPPGQLPGKSQVITLKLPASLLLRGGLTGWMKQVIQIPVTGLGQTIYVAGKSDWIADGFPSLIPVVLDKIDKKKEGIEIQFKPTANRGAVLRLLIANGVDVVNALNAIFVMDGPGSAAVEAYKTEAFRALGQHAFTGPLAVVPEPERRAILEHAQTTLHAIKVSTETYKNETYISFDLGGGESIYNDLQFSQSGMVAHRFNTDLLPALKSSAKAIVSNTVGGIELIAGLQHRDFLRENSMPPHFDVLKVYTPMNAIRHFAESDISSQQLADASILLHNDNRIEVVLAGPQK